MPEADAEWWISLDLDDQNGRMTETILNLYFLFFVRPEFRKEMLERIPSAFLPKFEAKRKLCGGEDDICMSSVRDSKSFSMF
jgi:hypothetical protein